MIRMFLLGITVALATAAFIASPAPIWAKRPEPVLTADQPWEARSVSEPTVVRDGSMWRMWYTGGWLQSAIGYAQSKDGERWTKHIGPVMGRGAGGFSESAGRSFVMQCGGLFYMFFTGVGDHPAMYAAESHDGVNWSHTQKIMDPGTSDTALANMAVWTEGGAWRMIYESRDVTGRHWSMGLAEGIDAYHWHKTAFPLPDLSVGGSYGGPTIKYEDGEYRLMYHAATSGDMPTRLYQAESADLLHWTTPHLALDMSLPWEADQVADPSVVGGRLYYAGMDNENEAGKIGLAVRRAQ